MTRRTSSRPPGATEPTVRAATAGDIRDVARTLAAAFVDDPTMQALCRRAADPRARLAALFELQIRTHYLPHGNVDLALDPATGDVLGAALWARPGRWKSPWWRQVVDLPVYVRALGRDLPTAVRLEAQSHAFHPRYPHWYLYVIGSTPEARGRGVGEALLRRGLVRAGTAPCYLEATSLDSARLYSRHGFEFMGPIEDRVGAHGGYGMWRAGGDRA